MLISEMIEKLQAIQNEHGDIKVKVQDNEFLVHSDVEIQVQEQWIRRCDWLEVHERIVELNY